MGGSSDELISGRYSIFWAMFQCYNWRIALEYNSHHYVIYNFVVCKGYDSVQ